ncbi:MAG: glycosyltransferase [Acidobacteria bacterium]|nr:glycosyltransferase [Acidobacteriota bacterium]
MQESRAPAVSVIVPGFNSSSTLEACLRAIRNQVCRCSFELIYVDDASDDDSVAIAEKWADRVIKLSDSSGPSLARNAGAQAARGQVLLFIDSDIEIREDTVHKLLNVLDQNPQVRAVFGSYDSLPRAPSLVSQYRNLLHHYIHQESSVEAETFWAGCGAVYRKIFDELGGFGRWPMEDVEFGYRLRAKGFAIQLEKRIQVKHLKRWTLANMIRTDLCHRGIPWVRLLFKYQRWTRSAGNLNLRVVDFASAGLLFLILLLILASFWDSSLLFWAGLVFTLVLLLNLRTYLYFARIRSFMFALRVVPLHATYHLVCGLAAIAGSFLYLIFEKHRSQDHF